MMLGRFSQLSSRQQTVRSFASDASNTTSIRLYRIILRMVNNLNDSFPLQEPLNPRDYGQARLFSMHTQGDDSSLNLYKLFATWHHDNPYIQTWYSAVSDFEYDDEEECFSLWASKAELKNAIRRAFCQSPSDDIVPMQGLAIDAIQNIQQQLRMQQRSSVSINVERGIRVVATSRYVSIAFMNGVVAFIAIFVLAMQYSLSC
jgi:hypothetical protein